MSRSETIRLRVTPAERAEIERRAEEAGAPVSAWLRGLALGDGVSPDARSQRWDVFRAEVRGVLRGQSRHLIGLIAAGEESSVLAAAHGAIARELGMDRSLTPQEVGIVRAAAQDLLGSVVSSLAGRIGQYGEPETEP